MAKMTGSAYGITGKLYLGHNFADYSHLGGRVEYEQSAVKGGISVLAYRYQEDEIDLLHYEADVSVDIAPLIKVSVQASNIDDGHDDTDDSRLFCILQIEPGIAVPVAGTLRPYLGIDTRDGIEQHVRIAGINCAPIENGYVKCEYRRDTETDEYASIQVGYTF
jgi:hypothetical protein